MKKSEYIAFYDLDHTILSVNSATALVEESIKRGVMTSGQYRHAIWLSILYKLGKRTSSFCVRKSIMPASSLPSDPKSLIVLTFIALPELRWFFFHRPPLPFVT